MKIPFTLLVSLISLTLFSQEPIISENHLLFTHDGKSYLLNDQKLYRITPQQTLFLKEVSIPKIEYKFVETDFGGFLISASGGIYFEFKTEDFDRLDDSFNFNSQYFNYTFHDENSLYSFGGYGLFTYKNIITEFDPSHKETFLYETNTPIDRHPIGRKKMIAEFSDNTLYIGNGLGLEPEKNSYDQKETWINDVWKFNLEDREWIPLGTSTLDMEGVTHFDFFYSNAECLLISPRKVAKIVISKNEIQLFENANFELIDTFNKSKFRYDLTINDSDQGIYAIVDQQNYSKKIQFIPFENFFGSKVHKRPFYSKPISYSYLLLIIGIVVAGGISFKLKARQKHKRTVVSLVNKKIKKLGIHLNTNDLKIIQTLLEIYPNSISFPDLMAHYDSNLSYESKKKKLRTSINNINRQLSFEFKKEPIELIEERDEMDLRIKRLKIDFKRTRS